MNYISTTSAQATSQSIRQAVQLLTPVLKRASLHGFNEAAWFSPPNQPGSEHSSSSPGLVAWNLIGTWLIGVATDSLSSEATLKAALEWFLGTAVKGG